MQASFGLFAKDLGFADESKGLFEGYKNRAVRPDYYLPVGDTGILLEVERGKTTINNMDFLDFRKLKCRPSKGLFTLELVGARPTDQRWDDVLKALGGLRKRYP